MDHPEYFFMWKTGAPHIATVCGWSRQEVVNKIRSTSQQTWKQIYARGGRIIKVKISISRDKKKEFKNEKRN